MGKMWQVVLAGSGGQGLGLAGQILAEAGGFLKGLYAVHNQSYGARARGGFSQSTVIISDREIVFPLVEEPNLVITFTQKGYDSNLPLLAADGLLLYDSDTVAPGSAASPGCSGDTRVKGFPFNAEALKLGHPLGVTLLALGTSARLTGIVEKKDMHQALSAHFQDRTLELNWRAFETGWNMTA